jgi:hypothetical protein
MKKIVVSGVIFLVVALLAPQIAQAQGTIYLSDLGRPPILWQLEQAVSLARNS